jgi:hypothetical protein
MSTDTSTAQLASAILRDLGLASIWQLNIAAAEADRNGFPKAAAAILEVAEAAENQRLLRQPRSYLPV